jgi:hypothetical protein
MPAVPSSIPRATPGGPVAILGGYRQVIDGVGATRTLAPEESGALCLFDRAAGVVYTLPAPSLQTVGLTYDFLVTTSVTSNAHKIITDAATTFLVGAVTMVTIATASPAGFSANGTTIRALSAAGTTTGGLIGETYKVTCISATQWAITGVCVGSGVIATPFATS